MRLRDATQQQTGSSAHQIVTEEHGKRSKSMPRLRRVKVASLAARGCRPSSRQFRRNPSLVLIPATGGGMPRVTCCF
jgi:hypothetical protein